MKMLIIAVMLQATSPEAGQTAPEATAPPAAEAPAAQAPTSQRDVTCTYDRVRRQNICTNPQGQVLRCRYEQFLGSRMPRRFCTTPAEDADMERESRQALDRQQHVRTP